MSTAVEGLLSFREAAAADMPKLVCVGYVDAVGDGKVSESGKYIVQPISLAAYGAGRRARVNFLYRPEWIVPAFDPNTIAEMVDDDEEAKKILSVYRRNINGRGSISTLRGLAGSDVGFERLSHRILSLPDASIEGVQMVLTEFFEERQQSGSPEIGYVLKQQATRTDQIDEESGKAIWIKENRYEVDSFFDVNDKALAKWTKAAAKSQGKIRVTYNGEAF